MDRSMPAPPPGGVVRTECLDAVSDPCATLPAVSDALAAGTLVVGVWVLIVAAALLLLRTVCLESLDGEQDDSDEQVSGHVPSG